MFESITHEPPPDNWPELGSYSFLNEDGTQWISDWAWGQPEYTYCIDWVTGVSEFWLDNTLVLESKSF